MHIWLEMVASRLELRVDEQRSRVGHGKCESKKDQKPHCHSRAPIVARGCLTTRFSRPLTCFWEPEDHHSRQGLLKMVGRRRRLLKYLESTNISAYRKLIDELGLRH